MPMSLSNASSSGRWNSSPGSWPHIARYKASRWKEANTLCNNDNACASCHSQIPVLYKALTVCYLVSRLSMCTLVLWQVLGTFFEVFNKACCS